MSFQVTKVNSEFIALLGYDSDNSTLRVIVYRGSNLIGYDYHHVPSRVFDSLANAASVGAVFNRIKTAYRHTQLDSQDTLAFYRDSITAMATTRVIVD